MKLSIVTLALIAGLQSALAMDCWQMREPEMTLCMQNQEMLSILRGTQTPQEPCQDVPPTQVLYKCEADCNNNQWSVSVKKVTVYSEAPIGVEERLIEQCKIALGKNNGTYLQSVNCSPAN